MLSNKTLIAIGGPTAVGKSSVALALAIKYNCEIINADSRQVYSELNIGVNKPSTEDLSMAPHHLIGHVSIHDEYNVGLYEKEAINTINKCFDRNDLVILVGGTGLYINAVLEGLDEFENTPPEIKKQVTDMYKSGGLVFIQNKLKEIDPEYASIVDLENPRRIMRALEFYYSSSEKFSSKRIRNKKPREFKAIKIFIDKDRSELYTMIDARVDYMIKKGLKDEAQQYYPNKDLKALQTVGYKEWFDHFEGSISENEAIDKIKQHTRNYAKRQWTWWRPLAWPSFESGQTKEIIDFINKN